MKKIQDAHRQVEKLLARGDYVTALQRLQKLGPINKQAREQINRTIKRIQKEAASELVAGRWSVAEGIFDVVSQHMDLLDADRREECRLLIGELQRCRENERNNAMLRAATHLASEKLFGEARVVAINAIQTCREPHLIGRFRRLLSGLPHTQGRYLVGFDSPYEPRQFWRLQGGAVLEIGFERNDDIPGGYGKFRLPPGSSARLGDVPSDWTDYLEISFLARTPGENPATFSVVLACPRGLFEFPAAVSGRGWIAMQVPLGTLVSKGEATLESVNAIIIANRGGGIEEFHLDEIRLKPK